MSRISSSILDLEISYNAHTLQDAQIERLPQGWYINVKDGVTTQKPYLTKAIQCFIESGFDLTIV